MWKDRRRKYANYSSGNRNLKSKDVAKIAKFIFIGVLGLTLLSLIAIPLFAVTLPSPDKVVRRDGFSTKIYDRNGKILYDIFDDQRRTPVKIEDVPAYLKQATIAIEDKNFYKHQGFDVLGILRGFGRCFIGHCEGGSTLTQQLVKNVFFSSDRSWFRKMKEFLLAVQIERKYSKDQILQMYLSEVPYGGNAIGVETASETYFGKKVGELNLVESAFLAGVPQSPTRFSPYSATPKAYVARATDVLRRMREDGYITKDQEEEAKNALPNIQFLAKGASFKAPHFVQYVQKILEDRYGAAAIEGGGLRVTTTLDLDLQDQAQQVVSDEIAKVQDTYHITNGAAVSMNPDTGEILAMVGSKDFNAKDYDGQVNVTTSLRQPGSAIKPFTYITAFKKGIMTPATMLMDAPTVFPGGAGQPDYEPKNYDGKFRGPVQVRYALGNSLNIPAVKTLAKVGVKDMLQTAYDAGITSLEPTKENLSRVGLSVTLGGGEVKLLELTNGYGSFMNGGYRIDPVAILEVKDKDGKVLEKKDPKKGKRIFDEADAFLIADILSDNNARKETFGPNSLLNISGRQVAVKTGTTNDRRDNWAVGGTSQVITGVWVGNNDNSVMKQVASGVSGASPIWRKIVLASLNGKPNIKFNIPSSVTTASVDMISGYHEHDGYPSRTEYFKKGTEPSTDDPIHQKLKICKSDGKLATPADIAGGSYDEKEFFVFKEEDPFGTPNRWQEGILSWLTTQTDARYHPPTEYCGTKNPVNVEFNNPHDQDSNLPNQFAINIKADSTSDITQIQLEIDGLVVRTFDGGPYEFDADLKKGVHTLRAIAKDSSGNQSDRTITVGVGVFWNATPTP
jgi:1A family penicillin-binding protein